MDEAPASRLRGSAHAQTGFPHRALVHVLFIALLGFLAYSNTFHVPFQWDEDIFIVGNPFVKDLGYFLEPSRAADSGFYTTLKSRYLGYLTFALNYRMHGLDVTGYHVVNLSIHILNALLVYLLAALTFGTPFLRKSPLSMHSGAIALFSGLLFVSHPVQTEAVTYVFQRLASLAAFFFLLSAAAYIGSRLSGGRLRSHALYALSLVSAVLAMKTKENAFTLPLVIALYEFLFFTGPIKRRTLRLVPLLLTLLIIPLSLTGTDKPVGEIISDVAAIRGYEGTPRWDYLITQFRVVVTYIRLLFLPVRQNIDYDYPVFTSLFDSRVALSALFLLSVFGLAVYLLHRSRQRAGLRIISLGVFWFFITLSVESSIIPIPMIINEYRVYLPSVGAFFALASVAFLLFGRLTDKRTRAVAGLFVILVPVVLSCATYARNGVWRSEISLWEDVVKKSPRKAKGYNNLGNAYRERGLTGKAIESYRTAIRLLPDFTMAHYNLGVAYGSAGFTDKAIEQYRTALRLKPDFVSAHINLGAAYGSAGSTDKAIEQYRAALELDPDNATVHYNLGIAYGSAGFTDKAIEQYRAALSIDPYYVDAHYNLGVIYLERGLSEKARTEFEMELKINPHNHSARQRLDRIPAIQ